MRSLVESAIEVLGEGQPGLERWHGLVKNMMKEMEKGKMKPEVKKWFDKVRGFEKTGTVPRDKK